MFIFDYSLSFWTDDTRKLFEFTSKSQEQFKEEKDLNDLIRTGKLFALLTFIVKKEVVNFKFQQPKEQDDILVSGWENEKIFYDWAIKNKINKITIELADKPDLIVMINDEENNKVGIELTTVSPYLKTNKGDTYTTNEKTQSLLCDKIASNLLSVNTKNDKFRLEVTNSTIIFENNKLNIIQKQKFEEGIKSVKNWAEVNSALFSENGLVMQDAGINMKGNESDTFILNLITEIESKNNKVSAYSTENNILLILVENIEHIIDIVSLAKNHSKEITYGDKIENYCCKKCYIKTIWLNISKEKKNFTNIVIVFKNTYKMPILFI